MIFTPFLSWWSSHGYTFGVYHQVGHASAYLSSFTKPLLPYALLLDVELWEKLNFYSLLLWTPYYKVNGSPFSSLEHQTTSLSSTTTQTASAIFSCADLLTSEVDITLKFKHILPFSPQHGWINQGIKSHNIKLPEKPQEQFYHPLLLSVPQRNKQFPRLSKHQAGEQDTSHFLQVPLVFASDIWGCGRGWGGLGFRPLVHGPYTL